MLAVILGVETIFELCFGRHNSFRLCSRSGSALDLMHPCLQLVLTLLSMGTYVRSLGGVKLTTYLCYVTNSSTCMPTYFGDAQACILLIQNTSHAPLVCLYAILSSVLIFFVILDRGY
jgi:hypothetical protein